MCEAEVLQSVSFLLPEYPKEDRKSALICVSVLKSCLCSSVRARKLEEHSPGVLVLFCWAAAAFRAFHIWFFWAELSERVFSMQIVYFCSMCESCLFKQSRGKLGIYVTIQTPQTTYYFLFQPPLVLGPCLCKFCASLLLLESAACMCSELKFGHLLYDLEKLPLKMKASVTLITRGAEMHSLSGVGTDVTP